MVIGVGGGRGQATVTRMPKCPALFETKINWIRKKKLILLRRPLEVMVGQASHGSHRRSCSSFVFFCALERIGRG